MCVTGAKRRKTRASEARLIWVLFLIGWKSGAKFDNQSQSVLNKNQSKREINIDIQLKSAPSATLWSHKVHSALLVLGYFEATLQGSIWDNWEQLMWNGSERRQLLFKGTMDPK